MRLLEASNRQNLPNFACFPLKVEVGTPFLLNGAIRGRLSGFLPVVVVF